MHRMLFYGGRRGGGGKKNDLGPLVVVPIVFITCRLDRSYLRMWNSRRVARLHPDVTVASDWKRCGYTALLSLIVGMKAGMRGFVNRSAKYLGTRYGYAASPVLRWHRLQGIGARV
jgi:hypothetical protein